MATSPKFYGSIPHHRKHILSKIGLIGFNWGSHWILLCRLGRCFWLIFLHHFTPKFMFANCIGHASTFWPPIKIRDKIFLRWPLIANWPQFAIASSYYVFKFKFKLFYCTIMFYTAKLSLTHHMAIPRNWPFPLIKSNLH